MGTLSRRKGANGEREVVALARAAGLSASREWANAQHPDPMVRCCDVQIAGEPYQIQVSRDGFERIYRELAGVRGFVFRRDRHEWLVALRLEDYLKLLVEQYGSCTQCSRFGQVRRVRRHRNLGSESASFPYR